MRNVEDVHNSQPWVARAGALSLGLGVREFMTT